MLEVCGVVLNDDSFAYHGTQFAIDEELPEFESVLFIDDADGDLPLNLVTEISNDSDDEDSTSTRDSIASGNTENRQNKPIEVLENQDLRVLREYCGPYAVQVDPDAGKTF